MPTKGETKQYYILQISALPEMCLDPADSQSSIEMLGGGIYAEMLAIRSRVAVVVCINTMTLQQRESPKDDSLQQCRDLMGVPLPQSYTPPRDHGQGAVQVGPTHC